MTDYTGVGLEDIVAHLRDWRDNTAMTIEFLEGQIPLSEGQVKLLENPRAVTSYVTYFVDLFKRYLADLERLVNEVPTGVQEKHIVILSQLFKSSEAEDRHCVQFRNEFVYKSLPHEEMRPFLDRLYGEVGDQLVDYQDLSNLVSRLRTFIGQVPLEGGEALKLTPQLWGMGVDLKVLWRKLRQWLRRRGSA